MTVDPALLLLADGRFPAGAHAHSFGVEASVAAGDVRTLADLEEYVRGRLATTGVVEAAFAAATCARLSGAGPSGAEPSGTGPVPWVELDDELAARTPSPVVRAASRSLGRQLLRAAAQVWPSPVYDSLRGEVTAPFQPIVLGTVTWAARLSPDDAALCSVHHLVTGLTSAAVRLLGIDPFHVASLVARLAPVMRATADEALAVAAGPIDQLPADTGLLADVLAEHHATWEVRLFAS